MKGFLVNALSSALIVTCWNVQVTVAGKTGLSVRGGVAAEIMQHGAARELQGQQEEAKEDGDGEEDENTSIVECFANTLAANPAEIISSAALIGCFPDLLTGFLAGGGEDQSLQVVLSCVAAAIGCDEQTDSPENENGENENDKPDQAQKPGTLGGIMGGLGDIFDGSN